MGMPCPCRPSASILEELERSQNGQKIDERDKSVHSMGRTPNPLQYEIVKDIIVNDFLIIMVVYPNCTNFEGKKILVFKGITLEKLKEQKLLDPHFSDSKKYVHPIARFVPNEMGWKMAVQLSENWNE
jgi:hypothetical protein